MACLACPCLCPACRIQFGSSPMARFGWRSFFVALGFGSLVWLLPWLRWMPSTPHVPPEERDAPGLLQFGRLRAAWGTCGGLFCANYISYFFITWMPFYLLRERHFSMSKMGAVAGGSYVAAALSALLWPPRRSLDQERRQSNSRPQDFHRRRSYRRRSLSCRLRARPAQSLDCHAHRRDHHLGSVRLQSLGHHLHGCRSGRRWTLDGHAELHRQFLRNARPRADRARARSNRSVLLAVCNRVGLLRGRGALLWRRPGKSRTGQLARSGRRCSKSHVGFGCLTRTLLGPRITN